MKMTEEQLRALLIEQNYVSAEDIKTRQESLVSELRATGDEIQSLMKTLEEEFGAGSLNLETGEFTSNPVEA